jgi:hypothetical protein
MSKFHITQRRGGGCFSVSVQVYRHWIIFMFLAKFVNGLFIRPLQEATIITWRAWLAMPPWVSYGLV